MTEHLQINLDETAKPRLGPDGTYTDDMGRIWETFMGAGRRLGISTGTICNNMPEDAAVLDGYNTVGSPTPLHLRGEIEAAVAHLIRIPSGRNVTDSGAYTTDRGKQYATAPKAAERFGVESCTISKIAGRIGARTLTGRDRQGTVTLYSLDDLAKDPTIRARIDERRGEKIRVDNKGYYTDPEGIVWATVNAFFDSLPPDIQNGTDKSSVWRQAKKYCRSQTAIDRGGRPNAEIFPVEELKTKASALMNEEFKVDKQARYYSEKDAERNEIMRWATKHAWLDLLKVTRYALKQGLENTYKTWENVPRRKGLSELGRPDWLYSEATMKEILAYIFDDEVQSENGIYVQKIIDETGGEIGTRVFKTSVTLKKEVHLTAENIKSRLLKASCPTVNGVDRHSGGKEELFDYDTFRRVFAEQLRVILKTSEDGDFIDPTYGRCITIGQFCEENPTISRHQLDKYLKSAQLTPKLRRRSTITKRVESLYPEKTLRALAVKAAQ